MPAQTPNLMKTMFPKDLDGNKIVGNIINNAIQSVGTGKNNVDKVVSQAREKVANLLKKGLITTDELKNFASGVMQTQNEVVEMFGGPGAKFIEEQNKLPEGWEQFSSSEKSKYLAGLNPQTGNLESMPFFMGGVQSVPGAYQQAVQSTVKRGVQSLGQKIRNEAAGLTITEKQRIPEVTEKMLRGDPKINAVKKELDKILPEVQKLESPIEHTISINTFKRQAEQLAYKQGMSYEDAVAQVSQSAAGNNVGVLTKISNRLLGRPLLADAENAIAAGRNDLARKVFENIAKQATLPGSAYAGYESLAKSFLKQFAK